MRSWKSLRTALVFVVALAAGLEIVHWLRIAAVEVRAGAALVPLVNADGSVRFRRWQVVRGTKPDDVRVRLTEYDLDGGVIREEEMDAIRMKPDWTASPSIAWKRHRASAAERFGRNADGRFKSRGSDWRAAVQSKLNRIQGTASAYESLKVGHRTSPVAPVRRPVWEFRDGRFVCRRHDENRTLGSFGPDGWTAGEPSSDAPRFEEKAVSPATRVDVSYPSMSQTPFALVDAGASEVVFLKIDAFGPDEKGEMRPKVDLATTPVPVVVTRVAVAAPDGEPTAPLSDDGSPSYAPQPSGDAVVVRAGPDVVIVRPDGTLRRARLDPDESDVQRAWCNPGAPGEDPDILSTVLLPIDAGRPRLRIRTWTRGGELVVRDVRAPVVTGAQRNAELFGHLPTLLRPPALTAVSFVLPGPADLDEDGSRWLLDSDVAGGAKAGWLAVSLAIAAFCALNARSRARLRAPEKSSVLFWTLVGAALGLLGLVLFAALTRKSVVAKCACGRRRAVHVETCPACAAEWPAPTPTGVEVFG
jgi:hypothetical protein